MKKYSIDRWEPAQGCWLWCGDGDTDNGTTAQLPDDIYEAADAFEGDDVEMTSEGETYRIYESK